MHFGKGIRSFHARNIGSVGQRASKLLAFKVGGLKKKSAALVFTAEVCASAFGLGSTSSVVKPFSNIDEL